MAGKCVNQSMGTNDMTYIAAAMHRADEVVAAELGLRLLDQYH